MKKTTILHSTAWSTIALAMIAGSAPAFAQSSAATAAATAPAPTATTTGSVPAPGTTSDDETIIVTGSLLRSTTTATPSPVTVVDTDAIDRRGLSTVQDAIQALASNNGPALTNSFTANGAFAAGASAVSLRGLSTNSTLVLFDGLRAAYYPLADDGSRNFVDLNTIPDDIIERIEVLRDGASSTYGADAIAGVVNIITKKQFKGVGGRVETGISERGDSATYRLTGTIGLGDLETNGYNAYVSGFYYQSDGLKSRERPYPYNSDDLRGVGTGGPNNTVNAPNTPFALGTAANFLVRPYASTDANFTTPLGRWQNLSGCGVGTPVALNTTQQGTANPATVCNYDFTNLYGNITPNIKRFGGSARFTANVTDSIEAYAEVNFLQSTVDYTGNPGVLYGAANTGILYQQYRTSGLGGGAYTADSNFLSLPVFVCAARVNCATAADRRLNPNNPFAAQGQVARLIGRAHDQDELQYNETRNRAYRAAFGVNGEFGDGWSFDVGATAMHVDLRRKTDGYVYIQRLLDVIADGSYNFINPSATPQSVKDYLTPVNITNSTSDQYQVQASVQRSLFELPGGPFQVAVGGSIRYEAVDAPSANDDYNGPRQRYFTLNAFGTKGNRTIYSAFGELSAPVLDQVEITGAGRYDKYSSGQDAFSPKVGVKFTPIRQAVIRGTWSKGFRIPSFGEANALPTTGFVANTAAVFNNAFLAQYGCTTANFSTVCPTYIRSGSYGQTTLASPNLQPEKSRSYTAGILLEPIRGVTFTVDYFNIKKTGAITQPSNAPALAAYYSGAAIPAGYTVIADAPDPNFPTARPRVAFVQSQLINANTIKSEGIDFSATVEFGVTDDLRFRTQLDASYILNLSTEFPDGTVEKYEGTLGNFNLTSGNGTQKWRGTWLTGIEYKKFELNGTLNYTSGYDFSAQDQGTGYRDCGLASGILGCHVKGYFTFDLGARVKITDDVTLYGTVLNLLDKLPPLDDQTYGAHLYNAVQGGNGILGRYFRAGARFGF